MLLHQLFTRSAARWPDALAVDIPPGPTRPERKTLTYAALQAQAHALAQHLSGMVHEECLVAILLGRETEFLYVAQLAVLGAGAAYVCLEPSFPDEQVREILRDSGAVALLTDAHGQARAKRAAFPTPVFNLSPDSLLSPPREYPGTTAQERRAGEERLAYVIYTSGTTGKPKGVLIEHHSIVNLVESDLVEFGLGPGDRVAQGSSPAYDSSVEELWLALASGATVVAMDDDTARLGPDLVPWLQRERITVLCPPPTLLRTLGCENPQEALPALRLLYVGGEALPRDIADRWAVGRRLVNGYGPTECTVTALRADILPGAPITIGTPVPGLRAWVLDEALAPVPDGSPGELCLGGRGLARGYHNRPELTAQKFVEHPELGRLYRTGDLAHRTPDGTFDYHGRLDAQVKLRGYRIELEAIEACLAECPGVREAVCTVQGSQLAAFIVPEDPTQAPEGAALQAALARVLPPYMVPALYGVLTALPKSVGGKLKREGLPRLTPPERRVAHLPQSPQEVRLAEAFQAILGLPEAAGRDDDFFLTLGGTSLQAAQLISHLRADPSTASVTVRDLYEARCVGELAKKLTPLAAPSPLQESAPPLGRGMLLTGLLQSLWLLLEVSVAAWLASRVLFAVLEREFLGLGLGLVLYPPATVLFAVLAKRALIGTYRAERVPVWGGRYLRHWLVVQVVRLIPWSLFVGTELQCVVLRALGARIGKRVHLHRGVDLTQGGWDLLTLEDDVTVGQDASLRLVDLEARQLVSGPVTLRAGATLEVRSGVGPGCCLESAASLAALSSLAAETTIPAGERWDGIPARPAGRTPVAPASPPSCSPWAYTLWLLLAQGALGLVLTLPWLFVWLAWGSASAVVLLTAALPLTLVLEAGAVRALGRVSEGVLSRWSLGYIRVWLKAGLVDSANAWLSGALFWPLWLRAAGMKVGRGCELSTIIDVVPELVEIGPETFFADGIYLGGPRVHQGTVTLGRVTVGSNVFLGNHVVIAGGQQVPDDLLLGVCTVAESALLRSGTAWFGHPPFALPKREVVACDRRLTHEPGALRYTNRLFWETLRFALPLVPTFVVYEGAEAVALAGKSVLWWSGPLAALAGLAALCGAILLLKWLLLGRAKPGTHPLWSCWCSRWDFLYVAWGLFARGTLTALEGTPMLIGYLRLMGLKLGRGVVLGPGFSQVVDPDMIEIGDGATVSAAFQAHTFEDRVLKLDKVRIGRGATVCHNTVPLYGATVGEGTFVAAHSVIMKEEHLLPGQRYEGAPTHLEGQP